MRRASIEKLQAFGILALAAALLGALIGLAAALLHRDRVARGCVVAPERVVAPEPAPVASASAPSPPEFARLLRSLEEPSPAPSAHPATRELPLPPAPRPAHVVSVAFDGDVGTSCIVQQQPGWPSDQIVLFPGDRVGEWQLVRIEKIDDGARIVFVGPSGERALVFRPRRDSE